jgi:3-hydroxyacyl-[acyl-carrier-protein] dehydratase
LRVSRKLRHDRPDRYRRVVTRRELCQFAREARLLKSKAIIDLSLLDFDNPIADIEAIRKLNPQRHEMEQLTSVLYEDLDRNACAALKEITDQEFWVRGHMPGMPLMPGVMMVEAVAQLSSYFTQKHDLLGATMVGFGGVDEVRFRGVVTPGDRLILMVELQKVRRGRMIVAAFQGFVDETIVLEGVLRGIPIPVKALEKHLASNKDG